MLQERFRKLIRASGKVMGLLLAVAALTINTLVPVYAYTLYSVGASTDTKSWQETEGGPSTGNDAVEACKNGIVRIITAIKMPDTGDLVEIQTGSGFLVNETLVATDSHVVTFDDAVMEMMQEMLDLTEAQIAEQTYISIESENGTKIDARILIQISNNDSCLLQLFQPIASRSALSLREDPIQRDDVCYSVAYSNLITEMGDSPYGSNEPIIHARIVEKIVEINGAKYLVSSAGNGGTGIGGPVVDENGCVMGIMSFVEYSEGTERMYATDIHELMRAMDAVGIEYAVKNAEDGQTTQTVGKGEEEQTTESTAEEEEDGSLRIDSGDAAEEQEDENKEDSRNWETEKQMKEKKSIFPLWSLQ